MNSTISRHTLGIFTGAMIAVTATGVAIAGAYSTQPNDPATPAIVSDQSQLAVWADANGLTGLSPASLTQVPNQSASFDQSDIAAWANANGLTGLSPASLRPAD